MTTPAHLKRIDTLQDCHRLLQTINNADFVEKKQQHRLSKEIKKSTTNNTVATEQNEQEVHLTTEERIILGKKRKRNVKCD